MDCFHHHNQQSSTCCCSHRCNTPPCQPPPPSPSTDPLLQSIVSQLLQNPQSAHLHYPHYPTPTLAFSSAATGPFDFHPCSSQYPQRQNHSQHQNQGHSNHKQFHPPQQPFEDQYSVLSSLLQRIDVLESSLHRFFSASSSAPSLTLRHLAARTIQTHFRAYLVRRSRALRELKVLASIRSALNVLKSSLSLQKRLDFFSLSCESMDLIRRLEAIQGGDQMIRDSKSSIRREIAEFLQYVDGICVKRIELVASKTVKNIRIVRNDDKSWVFSAGRGRGSAGACHRGKGSKNCNLDSDEKRLFDNLRGRVERIQGISKVLEYEQENTRIGEYNHDFDDGNGSIGSKNYADQCRRGDVIKKHRLQSHVDRRVPFLDDGNVTWVYDIHEDGKEPARRISGNTNREIVTDKQHEDEAGLESDSEENPAESAEGSEQDEDEAQNASEEGSSQGSEGEETPRKGSTTESNEKVILSNPHQNGKLILSAPAPVKMED